MVKFCDCCFYSDSPKDAEPCSGCGCLGKEYVEWFGLWDAEGNEIAPPTAYDYHGNPIVADGDLASFYRLIAEGKAGSCREYDLSRSGRNAFNNG